MSVISFAKHQVSMGQLREGEEPGQTENPLTRFIPTEMVTLYVGALAILPALETLEVGITNTFIFWFAAVLTPILFAYIYYVNKDEVVLWRLCWGMIASMVAFLAWGVAVPGNPIIDIAAAGGENATDTQIAGAAVAGFLAIFISTILAMLEPGLEKFFEKEVP